MFVILCLGSRLWLQAPLITVTLRFAFRCEAEPHDRKYFLQHLTDLLCTPH